MVQQNVWYTAKGIPHDMDMFAYPSSKIIVNSARARHPVHVATMRHIAVGSVMCLCINKLVKMIFGFSVES